MEPIKVGDTIYAKLGPHSRFFYPRLVIGETSRSWIVCDPKDSGFANYEWFIRECRKLAKSEKDWTRGTERDKVLADWVGKHIRTIDTNLEGELNNEIVLEVAKLLNVKQLSEIEL